MTDDWQDSLDAEIKKVLDTFNEDDLERFASELPDNLLDSIMPLLTAEVNQVNPNLLNFAQGLDEGFVAQPHLEYFSDRITQALIDVENGHNRRIICQMPPRSGKTTLGTIMASAFILQRHPNWPIAIVSHDGRLATSWGRQVRRWAEAGDLGSHIRIQKDAGAAGEWETSEHGKLLSISTRESFTGRGAKVLIVDDPHKDFIDAHSGTMRNNIWNWWQSVALTRLEPPSLVIITMTRWHEDDLVGRLLSSDYSGSADEWEVIRFPAIAEDEDTLGREIGSPLFSPLIDETPEEALERWQHIRSSVGEYVWSSMYQQRPSPASGAVFETSWWRFWTKDPAKATEDGRVILFNPEKDGQGGRWVDSWDCSFKGTDGSDFVVGQRWTKVGPNKFLIRQIRRRMSFTETVKAMEAWAGSDNYGRFVHERLIEDKANGTAAIDVLKKTISGLIPINPTESKVARARAITPEVEAGNVYLPHPNDPGNEWVADLLSELRNFPNDAHDDQVDSLTQALFRLRDIKAASVSSPINRPQIQRPTPSEAASSQRRSGSSPGRVIR